MHADVLKFVIAHRFSQTRRNIEVEYFILLIILCWLYNI